MREKVFNYRLATHSLPFVKTNFSVSRPKFIKKKVKCTLVQALRLCTGCMAHRGEEV